MIPAGGAGLLAMSYLCRSKKKENSESLGIGTKHWAGCNQVSTCLLTGKLRRFQKDLFPVEHEAAEGSVPCQAMLLTAFAGLFWGIPPLASEMAKIICLLCAKMKLTLQSFIM